MTTEEMAALVRLWFEQASRGFGHLLPDGWFGGRPYENQYVLIGVQVSDDSFVVILSEGTKLVVKKPKQVYVENSQLVIEGYEEATLRWKHYGGTDERELRYSDGQIRFVPPVGTVVSLK